MSRPTYIRINTQSAILNCRFLKAANPDSKLVAVVKANAYGHGAISIAKAIEREVDMLAVASVEEAIELRDANINCAILLLEGWFKKSELLKISENNLETVIHNQRQLSDLMHFKNLKDLNVWLKIDTGMHRLGIPVDQTDNVIATLKETESVKRIVLMTHFASADNLSSEFTQQQIDKFDQTVEKYSDLPVSMSNSAGQFAWSKSRRDWNRCGIMVYGISPFSEIGEAELNLVPVMEFISEVIAVRKVKAGESVGYGNSWIAEKDSVIATIACGYGDGYPRNARSGTPVLVNGERAYLAGTVSMDMITVDVTHITANPVNLGDQVELWGTNVPINEVARHADTIGYELLCRMPQRANRIVLF